MTKYCLGIIFLAMVLCLTATIPASAHVLKVDGSIGAVLHIPPADNPIAGKSINYVMTFSDDTGRFDLAKCDCRLIVRNDKGVVKNQAMGGGSSTVSYTNIAINDPGVYMFSFIGQHHTNGSFQDFKLDYDIRIASTASASATAIPVLLWVGIAMVVGLILLLSLRMGYN